MIAHSIISWDCSYRNFFHLIDGILGQDFPLESVEVIFVEQRNQKHADQYNHQFGLKSLSDHKEELKGRLNLRTIYLGQPTTDPYHLGKCVNEGIKLSRGKIISVMDGDMLLTPNFLKDLTEYHQEERKIANLFRHSAEYPIGVKSFNSWINANVDLKKCYFGCPTVAKKEIPAKVDNYGPMVSAEKRLWAAIGAYDEHPIWSTASSKAHFDVNIRLQNAANTQSKYLKKSFAVHPWHPIGLAEQDRKHKDYKLSGEILKIQQQLIAHSFENKNKHWKERYTLTESLYNSHLSKFMRLFKDELESFAKPQVQSDNLKKSTFPYRMRHLKRRIIYKLPTFQ